MLITFARMYVNAVEHNCVLMFFHAYPQSYKLHLDASFLT